MKQTKTISFKDMTLTPEGTFKAVFATMNVIDKDGDVTLPGAFGNQQVIIGGYNHGSWDRGKNALPVGKGRIYEEGDKAIVEAQFFMDMEAGAETYKAVKNVGDLQEWSYSLPNIDFEYRKENGQQVRVLKKIRVNEVAPVLMGAGEGTRTLDVKSESSPLTEHMEAVQAAVSGLVGRIKDLGELRAEKGRHPSEDTMKRTAQFKAALSDLIRELEDVQIDHDLIYREIVQFEKTIADRRAECHQQN